MARVVVPTKPRSAKSRPAASRMRTSRSEKLNLCALVTDIKVSIYLLIASPMDRVKPKSIERREGLVYQAVDKDPNSGRSKPGLHEPPKNPSDFRGPPIRLRRLGPTTGGLSPDGPLDRGPR